VLELDPRGRVAGLVEEGGVRPAGLIFGQPSSSLLGSELSHVVSMPAGYTPMTLLTGDVGGNAAKKSALKSTKQQQAAADKEAAVKVGPVHYLPGWHRDGRPLLLAVQMVGKPLPPGGAPPAAGAAGAGAAGALTAIIRLAPAGAQPSVLPPMMTGAGAGAMAAEPSAAAGVARRSSIIMLQPPAAAPVPWSPIKSPTVGAMSPGQAAAAAGGVQHYSHLTRDLAQLSRMGRKATAAAEGHSAAVIGSLSAPVSPLDPAVMGVAAALPPPPPLALLSVGQLPAPGVTRSLAARSGKAREGAPGEALLPGSGGTDSGAVIDSAVDYDRRARGSSGSGAGGGAALSPPPRSPASLPGAVVGDGEAEEGE
jgi:hypothetical protein